ncbi:bifunctional protein-serine/threonine kinase/phosphatase [Acinetobacter populi]|uniref:Protein kinase n=1 Tax=Acinetobacter populi TaxID=1582270 RepID=A0A1Z9YZK9_9GAMM|nr:bifunctional protein-serine/threonine kinase/phosphatase [Acinetobacter populi]OUY07649.1 protein kinase [Acinetobacter populi]
MPKTSKFSQLSVQLGQYSHAGRKAENQDFYGASLAENYLLQQKGMAFAIADGISSSNVSHIASETAVSSFLSDYFSTPDSWRVKTSAERVINACNSWLYAQTQQSQGRFDKDRGYVCTLSALILKANQAHIFHIGDARIYRLQSGQLEQLTIDHRVWLSSKESYLSRALGVNQKVEIDYCSVEIYPDDIFILMTDGAYEYLDKTIILDVLTQHQQLDEAAKLLVETAYEQGSSDNLTIQIIKVQTISYVSNGNFSAEYQNLSFAPNLEVGQSFEGYQIQKILRHNHRSCLYLAYDEVQQSSLVLKVPSADLQQDQCLLEQFFLEEWVAKRIDHPHVLAVYPHFRPKNFIYHTLQYIDGQTLTQWLAIQKQPVEIAQVVEIITQVAKGLNVMHRFEILHQDIRPENVMIDAQQHITLIDFGSSSVKGIAEFQPQHAHRALGTLAYMAPEYFIGQLSSTRSDQFSLAVMTYYLLCKQLPYATDIAKCRSKKQLKTLHYQSIQAYRPDIPDWFDAALQKALQLDPDQRYEALSEFIHDLKHVNPEFLRKAHSHLMAKNPLWFWQSLSAILLLLIIVGIVAIYYPH